MNLTFCLSFRKMSDDDLVELCGAVATNTVMEELFLSGHKLNPAALSAFDRMLRTNPSLKKLGFGDSTLGAEGLESVQSGLMTAKSLEYLDMEYKGLQAGPRSGDVLGSVIAGSSSLNFVVATRNAIDNEGLKELCDRLSACERHDWRTPLTLLLGENSFDADGMSYIAQLLASNFPVAKIDISNNKIGHHGAAAFCANSLGSLTCLNLAGCDLGDEGVEALAAALRNSTVTELDISSCNVTHMGGRHLGRCLSSGSSVLTTIIMRENESFKDQGVDVFISEIVTDSIDVAISLDMTKCGISSLGAIGLLNSRVKFTSLNLFGNTIGTNLLEVAETDGFSAALSNGAVEKLDMGGNKIDDRGMALLCARLECHDMLPSTTFLSLGGNTITESELWTEGTNKLAAARPQLELLWKTTTQPH